MTSSGFPPRPRIVYQAADDPADDPTAAAMSAGDPDSGFVSAERGPVFRRGARGAIVGETNADLADAAAEVRAGDRAADSAAEPAAPLSKLARLQAAVRTLGERVFVGPPSVSLPDRVPTGFAALDASLGGGLVRGALNEVFSGAAGDGAAEALLPALARLAARPPDPGDVEQEGRLFGGVNPADRLPGGVNQADRLPGGMNQADRLPGDLRQKERLLCWIHPSRSPYPPALVQAGADLSRWLVVRPADDDDHVWAIDLALRSGACEAVVAYVGDLSDRLLRRLQTAAEDGRTLGLFFRPAALAPRASPAAVRLVAEPCPAADPGRRRLELRVLKARGVPFPAPVFVEWSRDPLDKPQVSGVLDRADLAGRGGAFARQFGGDRA